MNISFNEFVEIVEKNIWSLEDIDKFCYGENITIEEKKTNNSIDINLIIIIIMGIIIFILVIVIVLLIIKLMKKDNDIKSDLLIKDERIIKEDE